MEATCFSGATLSSRYHTDEAQLLGRGKFSVVSRMRRREDSLPVALKTIQIFEMGTKERNECMNEIRLLQQMQHPHIICYLDCVIEQNELVVIMELAEQGDLSGLIKSAANEGVPLAPLVVWKLFTQVADALGYMHERRVMHRDIKPANVFMTAPHTVKLGDLGLGRYFSSKTDMVHSTVGTPYYMSPECIQGGGYEFKSDIWSLGCLLYELATLKSPFYTPGLNFYILGKKIMSRQFEPIAGGSPQLVELVDRMLQVIPADRLSAAEVFAMAQAGLAQMGGSSN
ncbi:hypothetical protein AB1Y20_004731 [Prymnesium parvum]|uniref:non-specific serine/threonine protein kinase n=1 Tax=Prymnesium parvum TaxID=97485 RepID=A0AB34IXM7_PRYPA